VLRGILRRHLCRAAKKLGVSAAAFQQQWLLMRGVRGSLCVARLWLLLQHCEAAAVTWVVVACGVQLEQASGCLRCV
jgi:uncharacterized membrane protein